MAINVVLDPPSRNDAPDVFVAKANQFAADLVVFAEQLNDTAAAISAAVAASALSISYVFSTTTADADPGNGKLRLNQATQNTATVIRADLLDNVGADWSTALAAISNSTSATKGFIQISKLGSPTTFLVFAVTSVSSPSGYRNITGQVMASSSANPFADGDTVIFEFTPNGDKGDTGATGPASGVGRQAIWIPAAAMAPRITNGPAAGAYETATNKSMLSTWDFDPATIEYAQFHLRMPKAWNEGTVTFAPVWSHAAASTNYKASWGLRGVAVSDGEVLDVAMGTGQVSNDTGGVADTLYVGPESPAITIANSPAAEDLVMFEVYRKADDATNDTLAVDARLHGVTVYITTDAGNDA